MTLFTTLLVLIVERLFKLGEHWQLDHRLEGAIPSDYAFFDVAHDGNDGDRDGGDFSTAPGVERAAI